MGVEIGVVVRDYNGLIIERDSQGNVKNFKGDEQTETYRKKNIEKFGQRDKEGIPVETKAYKIGKLTKGKKDPFSDQIKESNRRYEQWQQEQ